MKLRIDTTHPAIVRLTLYNNQKTIQHRFETDYNLSELLIPEIQKFLKKQKIRLDQISFVEVAAGAGHFSRMRTAVATANALIYGLDLKQPPISPVYDREPNITRSKQR